MLCLKGTRELPAFEPHTRLMSSSARVALPNLTLQRQQHSELCSRRILSWFPNPDVLFNINE